MKFSVVVSDSLSQNALAPCIHILCTQDWPADDYEVLLPDLGSFSREDAHFMAAFEKEYPQLRVLRGPTGLERRAERMDAAAREARGEILLFIESHCLAFRGWLKAYAELFERESPEIVIGRFKTVPTTSAVGNAEENFRSTVMQGFERLNLLPHYFDFHNAAVRKSAYLRLGGLDPDLPIMAEFDFGARAVADGLPLRPFPENCVAHINDSALSGYAKVVGLQGRDRTRILLKRGEAFQRRFFPNARFLAALPVLRLLRGPLVAVLALRKALAGGAFKVLIAAGLSSLAQRAFETFARDSHRLGQLAGLKGPAPSAQPVPAGR